MRERLEAVASASASIVLFLEYIPQNLYDWLATQLATGAVTSAYTMVERRLRTDVAFMNANGLLHFDAHYRNILTDGQRLYFADLGLATSPRFDLSADESGHHPVRTDRGRHERLLLEPVRREPSHSVPGRTGQPRHRPGLSNPLVIAPPGAEPRRTATAYSGAIDIRRPAMTIRPLPIVLIALALPATACNTGSEPASTFARPASSAPSAPRGVVSVTEAKAILAQWEEAEKKAAREGGTDWTAAEAELAAEISRTQSQVRKMIGESVEPARKPIVKPRFAIPGKVGGAPWFMAEFSRKGTTSWWQAIFKKTPAGWRTVAISATTTKSRPPAVARDKNGLATVVAADDGNTLIAAPRAIAQAQARLQSTFGQDRRARQLFTADSYARRNANVNRDNRKTLQNQWTTKIRTQPTPEIYALRTSAGGALVWYGIREQATMAARPGTSFNMGFTSRETAALSHGQRFNHKAVYKSAAIYLAVVPRSPGLVRVPAQWFTHVSITGS
ncbi:hypothetical protein ACFLIM_27400 [Nonomuraea sp. M3C6]|uniref:DUF8094 domain-containing protein n=1 Tax=Nonomuraea marmarensis TaxID=3351344 RepID=A0ABW7AHT9_9ACTN